MTAWTLHNFWRWFRICNSLQSEEIDLNQHFWSWPPTDPSLPTRPSPSKLVGKLSHEPLHAPSVTFDADSESVTLLKVKKLTWIDIFPTECRELVMLANPVLTMGFWTSLFKLDRHKCPKPMVTAGFLDLSQSCNLNGT